jgi:serine/threonine-protein kinase
MTEVTPDTLVDGRYRVLNRLGSGGMADVYCAEDSHLGRQVALKVLYQRFAQDAEFVERFKREAQAAAGLTHPNVVNVFDRGEHDGTYYIAMEYLPGSTLKEVIAERGALDQEAVIDIGVQILRAASFAHRRGVVHRDLKPTLGTPRSPTSVSRARARPR